MICSPTLDVHIALIPTVPTEWVTQCISSVVHAASLAGFTVTVNVFNGIVGHIGNTRQFGYSLGDGQYVTYVDCDDYVLPNAFSCLKESLAESPDLIITGETHLQNGNYTDRVPGIFHLIVYKREMLNNVDFHSHPLSIDVETKKLAMDKANAVINIPLCIYVQRMYWDSGSRILARKIRSMELKNEQSA